MDSSGKLRFVTFLTFVRFPLVLLFFTGAIVYTDPPLRSVGLFVATIALLAASAFTDFLDGYFARKLGVVTRFGAHADPLMDKFFHLAALPLLVYVATLKPHNHVHATLLLVLTLLFLARDQWVTFLRSIGSLYDASGRAHWFGKLRTAFNLPLVCLIYYAEEAPAGFPPLSRPFLFGLEALAIALTLLSIFVYTRRYGPYLRRSASLTGSEKMKPPP